MPPKDDRDLPQNQPPPQGYPPPGYPFPPQDYYTQQPQGPPPAYGYPSPPGIDTFNNCKFYDFLNFFTCIVLKRKG